MLVLKMTSVLLALHFCQIEGISIKYDLTYLLNAVMAGNLSVEEFSTNLKFKENLSVPAVGHFAPDCNFIEECGNQLNDVVQIMRESRERMTPKVDIVLQFKFRMDINILTRLKTPVNRTKLWLSASAGKYWIHFTLPDNITCDALELQFGTDDWELLMKPSTWLTHDSVKNVIGVGFGYNENLIGCNELHKVVPISSQLLTSINFGKSPGVVESFGLFKNRIDMLHARNAMFVKKFSRVEPNIDYYLTPESVGDEYHCRLLTLFWQDYDTQDGYRMGTIVRMRLIKSNRPPFLPRHVIPYIDAASCIFKDDIPWYAPSALDAISKHFKSVVITHVEWKELKSISVINYYAAVNRTSNKLNITLDFIIDYTDWLQYGHLVPTFRVCKYNWGVLETWLNLLKESFYPLQNAKVSTLIFPLTGQITGNYSHDGNIGFARRMSSHLIIGCGFHSVSFGTLNATAAAVIVETCKQINGSLYSLQSHIQLYPVVLLNDANSRYFENYIRPKLEEMKSARTNILTRHPEASVYFQLRFTGLTNTNLGNTFCDTETLSLYEYIEGISNWAVLNQIPLIMGRAFDDIRHRNYPTWFSVLRPVSPLFKHVNPYFVVRNQPPILDTSKIEPCIEWTTANITLTPTYFHKYYLGSIFYATYMPKDTSISMSEYEILLQFIFNRFDLVEVVIGKDSQQDFFEALGKLAIDGLDSGKSLLVSFDYKKISADEKMQVFQSLLNLTKGVLRANTSFVKGVNFSWGAFRESNISNGNSFNSTLHQNTILLGLGGSLNLSMGVAMTTSDCEVILLNSILVLNSSLPTRTENLLRASNYLICADTVDFYKYRNQKNLGVLLDTHLYVKKTARDYHPHLDLYFRITVAVEVTEKTLKEYLILLSRFKYFATNHNISYIIVNAFDVGSQIRNGWWKISNFSNLAEPSVYEERYSAFSGLPTWRPTFHSIPTSGNANETSNNIVLVLAVSGLALLIVVLGFGLWYYKNKASTYLSKAEEHEFRNGRQGKELTSEVSEFRHFDKKYELALADICIDPKDLLGRGNFGTVHKGVVNGEMVAFKRPNENCQATSFKSVLFEVKVLCFIGTHPNVVRFIGAYTKEIRNGILYIATELCSNGSLQDLLLTKKRVISNLEGADNETVLMEEEDSVCFHELHRFSKEIASGMEYIVGRNVLHGDLSARNVLLDGNFTCKIGDFGLSRKLYEYKEYVKKSQEPLPWKWMAFESLKNMQFTSKSDVWSFGVTLWEIYSLGSVPYGGLAWTPGFVDDLKDGLRLPTPEYATKQIYNTMFNCWSLDADERPTFTEMVGFFIPLLSTKYTVLDL